MSNHVTQKAVSAELASSIVGTWELISYTWRFPDGRTVAPWGASAGRIAYDAGGNMVAILMHEGRNEANGRSSSQETLSQYSAYFGTYQVDVARGIVRHQVTGSLHGENASGELQRTFEFEAEMLILGFTKVQGGVPVARRLVWKRISP